MESLMNLKSRLFLALTASLMVGVVAPVLADEPAPSAQAQPQTRPSRPVEQQLNAAADAMKNRAPQAAQVVEKGIAAVAATDVVNDAPKVGDKAELFELPDASGKNVKLADLLAKGPVVLTWYRGGWCPFCNIALHGMVEAEPTIRGLGATLVAISPETPDSAAETVKADDLKFEVLSDRGNRVARQYRIVYTVPDKVLGAMKSHKVDLEKRNGDASGELPLAVTYVIDQDRTIRWAFVSADYRKRAEPSDVIAALRALKH
jgi:peroxiredoxin